MDILPVIQVEDSDAKKCIENTFLSRILYLKTSEF